MKSFFNYCKTRSLPADKCCWKHFPFSSAILVCLFFLKKKKNSSSIPISEKRNSVEVRKRKPSFRSIVCFLVWVSSAVSSRVPLQKGIRLLVARAPFLNSGWEWRLSVFVLIRPASRSTFESRARATNSKAIRRKESGQEASSLDFALVCSNVSLVAG